MEDLLQTFFTVELAFIDLGRTLCMMKIMEISWAGGAEPVPQYAILGCGDYKT
jgi:hypothetical protein